ncbi:MAG: NERD domain-containing protein [Clostridia bacterium]|nr:NERD domain-containing protein [Clostridia bacterium]
MFIGLCILAIYVIKKLIDIFVDKNDYNDYIESKKIQERQQQISETLDIAFSKKEHEEVFSDDEYEKQGREAELKIINNIKRLFPKENIIHDSYFQTNTSTTQIDIVAVNTKGIYVIESKDYSGVLKGKCWEKYWTQILNKNKCKYKVYNPIYQNNSHIEALKKNFKKFNIPEEAFKSYIVFSDRCKLYITGTSKANIIKACELYYGLAGDFEQSKDILREEQVREVCTRLRNHTFVSRELKEHHKERLQNK